MNFKLRQKMEYQELATKSWAMGSEVIWPETPKEPPTPKKFLDIEEKHIHQWVTKFITAIHEMYVENNWHMKQCAESRCYKLCGKSGYCRVHYVKNYNKSYKKQ